MHRGKIEIATIEECPKNFQSEYSELWVRKRNSHIKTSSQIFSLKHPNPKITYRTELSGVKFQLFWNYISFSYSTNAKFYRPNRSERKTAIFRKLRWRRRTAHCPSESAASQVPDKATFVYVDSPTIYYYTSGRLLEVSSTCFHMCGFESTTVCLTLLPNVTEVDMLPYHDSPYFIKDTHMH